MAKKSPEERHELQSNNNVNLYVTPLHPHTFKTNFLQIQQKLPSGNLYIGINVPDTNSFGYDIKWVRIDPDVLDELLVALSYAKHVVENRT
jgi:hypothetical protein